MPVSFRHLAASLLLSYDGVANWLQAQIPASEYAARRDSLAARIGDGVVIALGGRTPITDFGTFFQLPAFHYLTNFREPDAAMVMVVRNKRPTTMLFVTPPSGMGARTAIYYGQLMDSAGVERTFGVKGRTLPALGAVADSFASLGLPVYQLADFEANDFAEEDSLSRGGSLVRNLVARHPGLVVKDGHEIVNQLRAKKSPAEIALLRRAAEISSEGHRAAMLAPEPSHEYEIKAALEYTFARLGGSRPSYGSIVGSGARATQLHYMKDDAPARPGELVVMDAATEYQGYAADVTRTIPVSGKYSREQRAIYQLVRDAQDAAERLSKPGMSARDAEDSSYAVRARGLAALGLIESERATIDPPWSEGCATRTRMCEQAYFWTVHGISHGIGLEVHDPAQFYTGNRTFQPGDVFTIEPGIYVNSSRFGLLPDTPKNRAFIAKVRAVAERYDNTGVRIEDDYVMTPQGLERISTAPREIGEIEALMAKRPPRAVP